MRVQTMSPSNSGEILSEMWWIFRGGAADERFRFDFDTYLAAAVIFFLRSGLIERLRSESNRLLKDVKWSEGEAHLQSVRLKMIELYRKMSEREFTISSIGTAVAVCATGFILSTVTILGEWMTYRLRLMRE